MNYRYQIGDKFYVVFRKIVWNPAKIYMTDANGVEWSRHEQGTSAYSIKEAKVIGRVSFVIEGAQHEDWQENYACPRYLIEFDDEEREEYTEEYITNESHSYITFFKTREEAEKYIEESK